MHHYAELDGDFFLADYSIEEVKELRHEVKFYEELRTKIKIASGDYVDLKAFEPHMRHLIDTYIGASHSKKLATFDDFSLIDLIVSKEEDAINDLPEDIQKDPEAVAETIENNVRKIITNERAKNPVHFDKMSELLKDLIEKRQKEVLGYKEYLEEIIELTKKTKNAEKAKQYPVLIDTLAKRALYDNLEKNEQLALKVHKELLIEKPDDWRGSRMKEKKIKNIIKKFIDDLKKVEEIFSLVVAQDDEY